MKNRVLSVCVGIIAAAACVGTSVAQWGTNSTNSLIVGDATSDGPMIVPHPDGGCYIAWQGPVGGQYNMIHLQRLSAAGVEMWAHNGVIAVAGNDSATFVGDFDLAIASDGNAIIANSINFSDANNPTVHQSNVQKFSAINGAKMWGTGGADIAVTTGALASRPVHVCSSPDGGCVVGYTLKLANNNGVCRFMRIGPTGAPAWTAPLPQVIENAGNVSISLVQLQQVAADGSFVALWGSGVNTSTVGLHTTKFTGSGGLAPGWGTSTSTANFMTVSGPLVIDVHGMTGFNFYNSRVIPDGGGGAIYGWSSFASSGFASPTEALVQHLLTNGAYKFGSCCDSGNVCVVSTAANCPSGNTFTPGGRNLEATDHDIVDLAQGRWSAHVSYNQADGTYFLGAGQGLNSNGVVRSGLVQKFSPSGARLFGPGGFTVMPQSSNTQVTVDRIVCTPTNDGGVVVVGNVVRGNTTTFRVVFSSKVKIDAFGDPNFVWNKLLNSDATTDKGRNGICLAAGSDNPLYTFVWGNRVAAAKITSSNGAPGVDAVPLTIDVDVPSSVNACDGDTVTLSIAVSGTPPISYRWQRHYAFNVNGNPDAYWGLSDGDSSFNCTIPSDGTTYSGTATNTLTIHNVHANFPSASCPNSDPTLNKYRCYIFNAGDSTAYSSEAQMIISGGACCATGGGACTFTCNASGCTGVFQGTGTTCSPANPCGGACCIGGVCSATFSAAQCSGTYMGDGMTCAPSPCIGSCCENLSGNCSATTGAQCLSGSVFSAAGSCQPNACAQPGACCNTISGACTIIAQPGCSFGGQQFQGANSLCNPSPCPPLGACCSTIDANYCVMLTQTTCTGVSTRNWRGASSTCAPSPCAQPAGVCCRGSTCTTTLASAASCSGSLTAGATAGASFISAGACNTGSSATPCCYADYNKVSGVSVQDIFDYLNDWFAGRPYANTGSNGTGALTVQNIFDFLNAWFAGC